MSGKRKYEAEKKRKNENKALEQRKLEELAHEERNKLLKNLAFAESVIKPNQNYAERVKLIREKRQDDLEFFDTKEEEDLEFFDTKEEEDLEFFDTVTGLNEEVIPPSKPLMIRDATEEEKAEMARDAAEKRFLAQYSRDLRSIRGNPIDPLNFHLDINHKPKAPLFESPKITKIELAGKEFFKECFNLLTDDNNILKINDHQKIQLDKDLYKKALKAKFIKTIESNITGINSNIPDVIRNYKDPLDKILETAVSKLAKEIESGKTTSLDTKANEQNRYWFNIPGKICDSLSNMFRQTSLMLGAEPTAAELFEKAAKYAEKLKLDLEKERGKAINPAAIKHSRKSAVDLINRGENTSKTRTL